MQVTITINGREVSRDVEPRQLLVHFIRDTPGLTGTHWGCDTSNCGACVVLMDGQPLKSCTALAAMCDGHEIRTAISGAICRCTGYKNIVAAVRWAAEHEAASRQEVS